MKRLISLLLTCMMYAAALSAQTGMAVAPLLSDKPSDNPAITKVILTGDDIGLPNVSVFKSLSVKGDSREGDNVKTAVARDAQKAVSKEVSYKKGAVYYGFYAMDPPNSKTRRYLLLLDNRLTGGDTVTLIYIMGNLSERDVRKLLTL